MGRYVLLRRTGASDSQMAERIAKMEGVRILDQTLGRAVLVEAPEARLEELRSQLRGWIVAEEVEYPRPDPVRHRIKKR